MPDVTYVSPSPADSLLKNNPLPIGSIVRALCQAAEAGPELLYELILKLSLRVEAAAPMYGLSLWTMEKGKGIRLGWAEGLLEDELAAGEKIVAGNALNQGRMAQRQSGRFIRQLCVDIFEDGLCRGGPLRQVRSSSK